MSAEIESDLDRFARRVDTFSERADMLDENAKRVAFDLKAAVEDFQREALTRIVRALKADPRGKEILFELVDDPVVYASFLAHGIVRPDPATAAKQALEQVRPYLTSHGGDVELVSVELPVVTVRLTGACNGCSQSATTLRELVESALLTQVSGVQRVEVAPNAPEPVMISLDSMGLKSTRATSTPDPAENGWTAGPTLDSLAEGKVSLWWAPDANDGDEAAALALVRIGDEVNAYANVCAHQGLSLERALVDTEGGVITCPWHGYKYTVSDGQCLSAPGKSLPTFAARVQDGQVWLRLAP